MTTELIKKAPSEAKKEVPQLLGQLLRLKPPQQFKVSDVSPIQVACPSLLQGLELEIEHCEEMTDAWRMNGMTIQEDGSLRNTGREFITAPSTLSVTSKLLTNFFVPGRFTERNYSDRCSVHVHNNCQDLTPDQLAGVLLLYQMAEDLFFEFVGEDRRSNIFCVPWAQTNLSYNMVSNILNKGPTALKGWQKYTAVNLAPLFTLGTIEFRQMHGTNDVQKILNWCNLIGCLFEYAKQNSLSTIMEWVKTLNTSSEYRSVIDAVFKQWGDLLRTDGFERRISEGVLNTKYLLMSTPKPAATKSPIFGFYDSLLMDLSSAPSFEQAEQDIGTTAPGTGGAGARIRAWDAQQALLARQRGTVEQGVEHAPATNQRFIRPLAGDHVLDDPDF